MIFVLLCSALYQECWLLYFNGLNAVIWAVSVLCFFLTVPWVCLQCVIVTFSGHTLLFYKGKSLSGLKLGPDSREK